MPTSNNKQTPAQTRTSLDNLRSACRTEIDNLRRELKDLETTINHSQIEVNKLAQRNSATAVHLQQIQAQLEPNYPDKIFVPAMKLFRRTGLSSQIG